MNLQPFASLFVTTYEMPRLLELVCAGIERQTYRNFEVLFCDDGSGPETEAVISDFKARTAIRCTHFWQEHLGFRKTKILNQGLRAAKGQICIFLDGDCVPDRNYIRDHIELQESDRYLAGRRVDLGEHLTSTLTAQQIREGYFDFPKWSMIWSALKKETEHLNRSIRVPFPVLRKLLGMEKIDDLKGCNYSVSKEVLQILNGFDESYVGYGREDTDVEIRLQNYGMKIKSLKGMALQYHLWHPRREFTPSNDNRLEELKKSKRYRCENGMLQR